MSEKDAPLSAEASRAVGPGPAPRQVIRSEQDARRKRNPKKDKSKEAVANETGVERAVTPIEVKPLRAPRASTRKPNSSRTEQEPNREQTATASRGSVKPRRRPNKNPGNDSKGEKEKESASTGKWWKSLRDVDPITLAPLSSLKEPPFELVDVNSDVKHRFDAKALAHYLLSTGKFVDPINRQEMTRQDCQRLDTHLRQYGMGEHARCTEMLDLQNRIQLRPGNVNNEDAIANLRREAGVITSHLFHYPSMREQRRETRRHTPGTGGAVTVMDDDEQWQSSLPLEVEDDFPDMPVIRRPTREDDFPPIAGQANANSVRPIAAPQSTPQPAVSWANVAETARTRTFTIQPTPEPVQQSTAASTGSWRVAAERPKLKLERLEPHLYIPSPSRPESIFGKARPVDSTNLYERGATVSLAVTNNIDYLCPYPPRLLRAAKTFGSVWLGSMEKRFKELVDAGTTRKVVQLDPMAESRRRLLQEIGVRYWGLHIVELDPEPNRFLEVSATPTSFAPPIMLHKALLQFPDLYSAEFSNTGGSNGLLFVGCPSSVTNHRVHELMCDILQARESEYDVMIMEAVRPDQKLVFVEVSSTERARKFYKKVVSSPLEGFRYHKVEWWPSGVEWVKAQVRLLSRSHAVELDPLRAQRKLDERRHREEELAKTGMTAWDGAVSEIDSKTIEAMRAKLAEEVDWDEEEDTDDNDGKHAARDDDDTSSDDSD